MDLRASCVFDVGYEDNGVPMTPSGIIEIRDIPENTRNYTRAQLELFLQRNLINLITTILGAEMKYDDINNYLMKLNSNYRDKVSEVMPYMVGVEEQEDDYEGEED